MDKTRRELIEQAMVVLSQPVADIKGANELLGEALKAREKTNFTLIVRPDGRAILTTEMEVDEQLHRQIATAFMRWRETANDILVLGNTQCVTVLDIKLELPQGKQA